MSEVAAAGDVVLDSRALEDIRRVLRRQLGHQRISGDDLEDVIGIVLLEFARAFVRGDVRNVQAWVTDVAQKRAVDHIRRMQRERKRRTELDDAALNAMPAPGESPALSSHDLASIRFQTKAIFAGMKRRQGESPGVDSIESFNCENLLQNHLDKIPWRELAEAAGGTAEEIKRRHNRIRKTWERCLEALRERVKGDPHPVWKWAQEVQS